MKRSLLIATIGFAVGTGIGAWQRHQQRQEAETWRMMPLESHGEALSCTADVQAKMITCFSSRGAMSCDGNDIGPGINEYCMRAEPCVDPVTGELGYCYPEGAK